MAIGRVPGAALLPELDRQGIDLQFTTNSQTLAYLDFANYRLGINTVTPVQALEVNGNVQISSGNLYTSGNLTYDIGQWNHQFRNVYAQNLVATNFTGTINTSSQPNITSLGTLVSLSVTGNISSANNLLPTANVSGNVGYSSLWWNNVYANTINAAQVYGTIQTANQPLIANLANIALTNLTASNTVTATNSVATTVTATNVYGTILTPTQLSIANLSNIRATSITVDSNVNIFGNTVAHTLYADEIYDTGHRVLTNNTTLNVTGDATGSGLYSNISITLVDTGAVAGVYGAADDEYTDKIPKITVDSKGRITNIANVILTQVSNVTFTNTTLSTVGNINLTPSSHIITAGNSRIANVANPVQSQDVVTLSHLNAELATISSGLGVGDTTINIIDDGSNPGAIEIAVDGQVIGNIFANVSEFYNTVNIGNLSITDRTISSEGNIILSATGLGIVQVAGVHAIGIPAGDSSGRPVDAMTGYLRFNTDTDSIEYYDGTGWAFPGAAVITTEVITPDGTSNVYALSGNATTNGVLVSINGTLQQPSTSYSVYGNQIYFTEVPHNTDIIEVRNITSGVVALPEIASGNSSITIDPYGSIVFTVDNEPAVSIEASGAIVGALPNVTIATAGVTTTIDSFNKNVYRTAKYIIQTSIGSEYESCEVLVTHDGTDAYKTTYGVVSTNNELGNVSAAISTNTVLVQYTANYNNANVRISKNYLTI